jgi:predicted DNA-binding transcriptional regulator YafY
MHISKNPWQVISMKTHRLLSIVLYLLNHETVSAAKLAERFEVSRRTVLRDIEQISLAGIPIKSLPGANGGYSIMEGFKIDGRLVNKEEQESILTALQGFLSAYDNRRFSDVLEKISSLFPKQNNQHIFLDFGASGEKPAIQAKLTALEKAVTEKKAVQISYVNAYGESSRRVVEPVALNYRWYAWYLVAYCQTKRDYRVFKLARINRLEATDKTHTKEHGDSAVLLEQAFQGMGRRSLEVTLLCKAAVKTQAGEYLGGTITETFENGDFMMRMSVLNDERAWFAMLLSFGNQVTVIEPEELIIRLAETAGNILALYKK